MNRIRSALRGDDQGLSLVELIVTIGLAGLVLSLVVSLFSMVTQVSYSAIGVRSSTADASNIMDPIRTAVRSAIQSPVAGSSSLLPAVVDARTTSLTVIGYSDAYAAAPSANPVPQQFQYALTGGRIQEKRWNGTATTVGLTTYYTFPGIGAAASASRYLGDTVVNANTQPVFRYFDATGNELLPGAGSLSASDMANVRSVTVTVVLLGNSSNTPVTVTADIGMPNLQ